MGRATDERDRNQGRERAEETVPLRSAPVERVKGMLDRLLARTADHLVLAMIRKGEPTALVLSAEEYEGFLHTMEVMDDKEAQAAILAGEDDLRAGRVRDYEDVRRDLGIA